MLARPDLGLTQPLFRTDEMRVPIQIEHLMLHVVCEAHREVRRAARWNTGKEWAGKEHGQLVVGVGIEKTLFQMAMWDIPR